MRSYRIFFVLVISLWIGNLGSCSMDAEHLTLAENGKSTYRIVISQNPSPSIQYAAEELQKFLAQMTEATLPIVTDQEEPTEQEILIGNSERFRQAGIALDITALGVEGYYLKTVGSRLVIAGGPQRGALYGVYGLLDDHLGCRWFTSGKPGSGPYYSPKVSPRKPLVVPEINRIPKYSRLEIPLLDEKKVPVLEYREVFTCDCFDGDWCARNRVNSHASELEAKHGGKVAIASLAHTFNALVPPQKYFDEHPEYFSLVNGRRVKDYTQLCCTNEEVIRVCTQAVLETMRAVPEGRIFSVSQNDCFNYCECENCQKLARQEESQMAPVLMLVNRVAEAVEKEFPQNTVQTLAYQWTRKPPKTIRPRKNVVIQLCSIECCFSHPLATCDSDANRAFRKDLEAWSKTGARLWVWDYVTCFTHYLMPFPNQHVRRDNIRFYVQHGVTGIFEQDVFNTPHGELSALGGYLTARFLWNPDYDETQAINEFLTAYYGSAAETVNDYLKLLQNRVEKKNIHVHIFESLVSPHLADDLLIEANALWQKAEEQTSNDPVVLQRVKISRMSVDYAIVERARLQIAGHLPVNEDLKILALHRVEPYLETLKQSGLARLAEVVPLNFDQYRKGLISALGVNIP
ncbi:MAG: DUF4838 domain-containing protein [Sedimentisphaerales bacterium]|nr:DUF4838 domain-containing protein [Sedimentisphaerales bacterium]